jgi:glycosyltransferase involved in cell wall biosynthesis
MMLTSALRMTRGFLSRLNSADSVPQALSSVEPHRERGLDPKISRQVIESVFKPNVTIVIPALNEAEAISEVIEELRKEDYQNILVVDGYSTDRTDSIAFGSGVKLVYQHGIGKAGAVKTAIERVETPYVVFIDADHTYDPKDIWRMLLHSKHYSHVIGTRDRKYIPRVHRFGNWVISQVFSVLFGVKVRDVCSGMYLLETEEAKKYRLEETGFNVEIELAAQSASRENLTEVPIEYRPRMGQKKLSTWNGFSILRAAFSLARRYNPILLYSSLTGLSVVPAALVLGWVALEVLTARVWHSGWALVGIMLLLIAAQAFTLASVSILTKHSERRLMEEIRSSRQQPESAV